MFAPDDIQILRAIDGEALINRQTAQYLINPK